MVDNVQSRLERANFDKMINAKIRECKWFVLETVWEEIWLDFVFAELGFDPSYLYKSAQEEEEMATMNDLEKEMILNDRHAEAETCNVKIRHLEQQRAKIQKEIEAKQAAEKIKEPPKKR